ncbi:3-ketoacyl-CoA synthase 7 [Tasmannia lanceolata]|uniref:3-ketoacyl-CoA synthase 7 n=1 Tax=Tasmannia lanceolata TaxID=3420 RepID=UPI004063E8D0
MAVPEIPLLNLAGRITQGQIPLTSLYLLAATFLTLVALYFLSRPNPLYIIDFSCYKAPDSNRVTIANFLEHSVIENLFTDEVFEFQAKVLERGGIGEETCMPLKVHQLPVDSSISSSIEEIETVLFAMVQDLFAKHNINPRTIDILISNCSLFCPTPSISSMIINKFNFRSNVLSFNLSGMGCSAGILSISLARDLLKVHKNSLALVLSMEAVSPNGYAGKIKSMILPNCLFRMGGAAILLSNRKQDKKKAKYMLQHLIRMHLGSEDRSYKCVFQEQDSDGWVGVSLSREIINVASRALKINIASLGPLILPYSEQFRYGFSVIRQKVWAPMGRTDGVYVPNFRKAFKHFCIHAGGRAVIEGIKEKLGLSEEDVEASKMTLYRFGNTSSSSIWYELCYLEAKGRVKRGDRVWQISFGSGFKCNSAVWKCISEFPPQVDNAWSDRIQLYPVEVPEVLDH